MPRFHRQIVIGHHVRQGRRTSLVPASRVRGGPSRRLRKTLWMSAGRNSAGSITTCFDQSSPRCAKRLRRTRGRNGGLARASVSALPLNRELSGMLMQQSARSAKDGSFTLTSVAPGDYTLQARSIQVFTSNQGDNVMVFRATAMAGGDSESGSTPLSISGEDLTGVVLTTSKGGITGHITFDGRGPRQLRRSHLGGSARSNGWSGFWWRFDDEGGLDRSRSRVSAARADPREQRAAGMDAEIGQAEWHRHHRHRRRLQARRDHGRPRDRAHQQVNGRQWRRHSRGRNRAEGLHRGHLRGIPRLLATPDEHAG